MSYYKSKSKDIIGNSCYIIMSLPCCYIGIKWAHPFDWDKNIKVFTSFGDNINFGQDSSNKIELNTDALESTIYNMKIG